MSVRRLAEPHLQPASFAFSDENVAWAKKQIAKYPEGRQQSAIIPLLWRAQEQNGGWLPEVAIRHVADMRAAQHGNAGRQRRFSRHFEGSPVGVRRSPRQNLFGCV